PRPPPALRSFPTRRSSDLTSNLRTADVTTASPTAIDVTTSPPAAVAPIGPITDARAPASNWPRPGPVVVNMLFTLVTRPRISSRSEEHTSELQSLRHLVCR